MRDAPSLTLIDSLLKSGLMFVHTTRSNAEAQKYLDDKIYYAKIFTMQL